MNVSRPAAFFLCAWIVCAALLLLPYLSLVPFWDAGWYTACLLSAVEAPFHLKHFNCVGHTSFAYMLTLAVGQYVSYANMPLLHLTNLSLLACASIGFFYIARWMNPDYGDDTEAALLTGTFVLSPLVLSNLLHLNLDYGVMVFFTMYLGALVWQRYVLAALAGIALVFTKEIGPLLITGAVILWVLLLLLWRKPPSARTIALLLVPVVLFVARTLYRYVRHPDRNLFYTEEGYSFAERSPLALALDINVFELTLQTYLFDLFGLHFRWILGALLVVGAGFILIRRQMIRVVPLRALFIFLVACGAIYLVTRHRPFNHVRYVLAAVPLVTLVGYVGALQWLTATARKCVLWTLLFLSVLSNFRSLDPATLAFFGTFQFGEHRAPNMSSGFFTPNPVHPHFVRDESVHSLEIFRISTLTESIFQALSFTAYDTILGSSGSKFFFPEFVDVDSRQRVGRRGGGVFRPHYLDSTKVFADMVEKPDLLRYIEYPMIPSPADREALSQWYELSGIREFSHQGYSLKVYEFVKSSR